MSCCGNKRRKEKIKRVMERRIFENNTFKILRLLKNRQSKSLNDKLLVEYHRKCHMLYAEASERLPINKVFINQVVEMHDQYVKEMIRRGMKHNSPLQRV